MDEYDRVPQEEDNNRLPTNVLDEETVPKTTLEPLEVDLESEDGLQRPPTPTIRFHDPLWIISVGFTLFLVLPTLLLGVCLTLSLVGRIWPATLFSLHLTIALWAARDRVPTEDEDGIPLSRRFGPARRWLPAVLDIGLFGFLYAGITGLLIGPDFFTDRLDGTPVIEWIEYRQKCVWIQGAGLAVAGGRAIQETMSLGLLCYHRLCDFNLQDDPRLPRPIVTAFARFKDHCDIALPEQRRRRVRTVLRRMFAILTIASLGILIWCINSILVHCVSWTAPVQNSHCDDLDTTECFLPFPSFHHMVRDSSTATGWRVHLQGDVMPPLKGRLEMHPSFLNELDGFSTMAPLMFYMAGMKHADALGTSNVRLQGSQNIELSVTEHSITLLVDVEAQKLVPHTAEIDHIDPERPLILVFPAQPLSHNRHFALAVVHATDVDEVRLPPTDGMQLLQLSSNEHDTGDSERRSRYRSKVIPALLEAAPWLDYESDPELLQLLFDFQTISAKSQLGPIRAVRDATIEYIESYKWGDWANRVRVVRQEDGTCDHPNDLVARTIHGELDVPWFLEGFGPGYRGAFLDTSAVTSKEPVTIGKAKFVVHIPCSIRAAAIQNANGTALRSVMEFGHGLFYNRDEASDWFLLRMANANGFIITAMDWRGMSSYDLLVVVETLMSKPRQFQFVRDNLIQGYANKLALQHFSRHAMLDLPWCKFHSESVDELHSIPFYHGIQPSYSFYGISQGGILGAGYTALSGTTSLIDHAILGSPGTPFALIMTRSEAFLAYDAILLLNFYNNRHVRVLLSLVQMAWDSVEGSGLLAASVMETFPPTLIQTGLGDATVSTIAAEALARAYGASILPNNPRTNVYGIPMSLAANVTFDGPRATLTEIMYEKEYQSLPVDDELSRPNAVHVCVRKDPHLMEQVAEFISTGRVIDPCITDGCRRKRVRCGEPV